NRFLQKIKEQYFELTEVIAQALNGCFPSQHFAADELGYVVIHFVTSLERNPANQALSALVLCSSGIGTARILETRIRKYLPEIQQIQIAKISEMNQLDFQQYDVILSTIFLPGFTFPYKLISPLLLEDEIKTIRTML